MWVLQSAQMIAVSVIVFVLQNRVMKKITEANNRAESRKTESLLSLNLMYATAELASATAVALKRGQTNGETEEAMKTCEKAKKRYIQFLHEQAEDHLHETD